MPSPGDKSHSPALSSTVWLLERPNFIEGFATVQPIEKATEKKCWRTKWDSNWRYNSENISLRCRPNFRSCHPKWPVEKNPQKGARIYFAPQSHQSSSRPGKWLDHRCFRQFASCGPLGRGRLANHRLRPRWKVAVSAIKFAQME